MALGSVFLSSVQVANWPWLYVHYFSDFMFSVFVVSHGFMLWKHGFMCILSCVIVSNVSSFQDILRCWVRKNPVSSDRLQKDSIARTILSKEPSFDADFSTHPDANPVSRRRGLVRWQLNPEKDWGPKPRAARSAQAVEERKQAQDAKCRERKAKRKAENKARQVSSLWERGM